MLQRDVLVVSNDMCKLAIPVEELSQIELPNSLQQAMVSQLDRLQPQCAACIKAASVMGMQFPAVVLGELSLQMTGTEWAMKAVSYFELAAKAALEASMN